MVETPAPVKPRARRRWLKIALGLAVGVFGLLCVVAGALAAAAAWLVTDDGNDFVRAKVESFGTDALESGALTIGRLKADYIRGLMLEDIALSDAAGRPVIAVERLRLDWNPMAAMGGTLPIHSLRIASPRLDVRVDGEGVNDFTRLFGASEETSDAPGEPFGGLPVAIDLETLELRDGALAWRTPDGAWALEGMNLTLSAEGEGRVIEIPDLLLQAGLTEPAVMPLTLSGGAAYVEGDVALEKLALKVGESRLGVGGRVGAVEVDPAMDLKIVLPALETDDLEALFGDLGLSGALGAELSLTGPLSELSLGGHLDIPEGRVDVAVGGDFAAEVPTWSLSLQPRRLKVGSLVDAVTEPVALVGSIDFEGEGFSWPDQLDARGGIRLHAPVVWGYDFEAMAVDLAVSGGRVGVTGLRVVAPWGVATGDGSVTESGAEMDVELVLGDLAGLAALDVHGLGGRGRLEGHASVDWSGEVVDTLFRGRLDADDLELWGGAVITEADVLIDELRVDGAGTHVLGSMEAHSITASAAHVAQLTGDIEVTVDTDGTVHWDLKPIISDLTVAEVPLAGEAVGEIKGQMAKGGQPIGRTSLLLNDLLPSYYKWGEGVLTADLNGDDVDVCFSVKEWREAKPLHPFQDGAAAWCSPIPDPEGGRDVVLFLGGMNMVTGIPSVEQILFAPDDQTRWATRQGVELILGEGIEVRARGRQGPVGDIASSGLHLESEAGSLSVAGHFDPAGRLDAGLIVRDFDLGWLARTLPMVAKDWGGHVTLHLGLAGTGRAPEVTAEVDLKGVTIPGQLANLYGKLSARTEGRQLVVRQGSLGRESWPLLAISGALPLDLNMEAPGFNIDEPIDLEVFLAPTSTKWIEEVVPAAGDLPEGQASAALRITGTPLAPEVELSASARLPAGARWVRVNGEVEIAGEELSIRLMGEDSGGVRLLEATGDLKTGLPAVLDAALAGGPEVDTADPAVWVKEMDIRVVPTQAPLATLSAFAGADALITGHLAGGLAIRGTPAEPEIHAGFLIPDGQLGDVPLRLPTFSLTPRLKGYELKGRLEFPTGAITANAYIPLTLSADMDVDAQLAREGFLAHVNMEGEGIPLELLSAFDPGIRGAEGFLRLEGEVEGSLAAPGLDLELSLEGGAFDYAPLGVHFGGLAMRTELRDDRIRMRSLELDTIPMDAVNQKNPLALITDELTSLTGNEAGHISGALSVGLADWTPTRIEGELKTTGAWVSATRKQSLQLTGDVAVSGDWPKLALTGDITTDTAQLVMGESDFLGSQSLELDSRIRVVRDQDVEPPPPPPDIPPFYHPWDINIALDLAQRAMIDVAVPMAADYGQVSAALSTTKLEARLDGTLDIHMRGDDLELSGELETMRGAVEVFAKEFTLDEGLIQFTGADYADPTLDIGATFRSPQYGDITVAIDGSPSEMELDFDSSEGYDEMDIASILLLGMPASELSQSQGGAGGNLVGAAIAMMGSAASDVGAMGNLDMLEVEGSDDALIGGVKAGRALSDKLFLIVGFDFEAEEDENTTEATIEWLISRQVFAEFVTGDAGESSADLYMRWRF